MNSFSINSLTFFLFLSLSHFLSLSLSLFLYLSFYLYFTLSLFLSIYLSLFISLFHSLSLYLSFSLSFYLSIYHSHSHYLYLYLFSSHYEFHFLEFEKKLKDTVSVKSYLPRNGTRPAKSTWKIRKNFPQNYNKYDFQLQMKFQKSVRKRNYLHQWFSLFYLLNLSCFRLFFLWFHRFFH